MNILRLMLCASIFITMAACGEDKKAVAPSNSSNAVPEHEDHADHADGDAKPEAQAMHDDHAGEGEAKHQGHDEGEAKHDEHAGEGEESHEGHEEGEEEGEPDFAKIDPKRADDLGLQLVVAEKTEIAQTVTLTGRLLIDPAKIANVRARFSGPVISVSKNIGDAVKRGETLAVIESNESLTRYPVQSPMTGVITARMTNPGDVAGSEALFTISDVSGLLAELKLFPAEQGRVAMGNTVVLATANGSLTGSVSALMPGLDELTQAQNVRVRLEPTGLAVTSGQFVSAAINVGADNGGNSITALAVPITSVQRLEGRDVVFVPEATGFRARPVKLGVASATVVEVLSGLKAGETVVAAGSFLLKADIGKNSAEHEH